MKIPDSNRPGGWRHLDFAPRLPWGEDTTIQWGKSSYGGFFLEAYPPGTYLTGHGATLAEAEDRAWTQHQRELACPEHRWSPHQPGHGERLDGYGVCLDCRRHQSDVLPVRTVCARCGEIAKLYSSLLCQPCYDKCDDAELERQDPIAAEHRRHSRELEAWKASYTPEQQTEILVNAIGEIFDRLGGE